MSITQEINRIRNNIENAFDAVETRGGAVDSRKSQNLQSAIFSIPSGGSSGSTLSDFRLGRDWFISESVKFPGLFEGSSPISVTKGPDKFVGIGNGGVVYSDDGINWVKGEIPLDDGNIVYWSYVKYLHDRYIAIPRSASHTYGVFAYSYDGVQWMLGSNSTVRKVITSSLSYGNGIYAGASESNSYVFKSTNGINWQLVNSISGRSITFMNGYFWIVNDTNTIYRTADFTDIDEINITPNTLQLLRIASYENTFVATAEQCLIVSLNNGAGWKRIDFTSLGKFEDMQPACYDGFWMFPFLPTDSTSSDPCFVLYTTDFVHYGIGKYPNTYRNKLYSGLQGAYGNGMLLVAAYAKTQPLISIAPIPTDPDDFPITVT